MKRVLIIGVAALSSSALLAACGGSSTSSAKEQQIRRDADLYQINQIERDWHEALTLHDINEMMSLYAPDATFTPKPGVTLTGKAQIRHFWTDVAKVTDPRVHWVLDTPAFKIRETVNGDRGTLYFECDHIDLKTRKVIAVTGADQQVARIDGRWLITNVLVASPELSA